MPGNLIKINNSKDLEWYVGDSEMEKLIEHLNKIGNKEEPENDRDRIQAKQKD